jgi:hypothetical protein
MNCAPILGSVWPGSVQEWVVQKMMLGSLIKAVVITLLGFAAVGVTTWGLITKDVNPDGLTMTLLGLVAYLVVWIVGLFLAKPSPSS